MRSVTVEVGETVFAAHPLAFVELREVGEAIADDDDSVDIDYIRPSLQAIYDRRQFLLDENRPAAVERRHSKNRRTVRENITQLIDEGTWVEYGPLAIAGQSKKRSLEELIRKTPADGLVAGIGSVNGDLFDAKRARTIFISYDDTVFAGTQGGRGHEKTDRMMELANDLSLPLIFHCEGAGGRSGDTDGSSAGHPDVRTWEKMGYLSGTVPMIGVTAGWCYAGNAAILGCTDIIIATEDSLIAMGGPATIEGGGMGAFLPAEVGPMSDLAPAGSVDIVVKDQDEAICGVEEGAVVLPGIDRRVGGERPAPAAAHYSGEARPGVRHSGGDSDPGRQGFGAGAAAGVRAERGDRVHPDRGAAVRADGEQQRVYQRGDRQRRLRQDSPVSGNYATLSTSRSSRWWTRRA